MKLVYALHIMWYEFAMIKEHFTSIKQAIQFTNIPVKLIVCANLQTYIEQPEDSLLMNKFLDTVNEELSHFEHVELLVKTNDDAFYNIGDFRREVRNASGYTIWGEIDCLIPKTYFGILETLSTDPDISTHPHVVTLSSRKMWDDTWTPVEHLSLQTVFEKDTPKPFHHNDYITQTELDMFNDQFEPSVVTLYDVKLDGALVALHSEVPLLIPYDMHFAREDYIAQIVLRMAGIPQYHLTTVLKGHNYKHPDKRKNTKSSRNDSVYKTYEKESFEAGMRYLNLLGGKHE